LIFLPDTFAEPPAELGLEVAKRVCPDVDPSRLGWQLCPVSSGSKEERDREIALAATRWANAQSDRESLKFEPKVLRRGSDEWMILIARYT
jgi:hypothetical protein